MKLSIILKRSKTSLTFLKAILSTSWCPGSYELKRRLKNIESSEPKLITDTKSLFFIKLGLKSIQQVKPVPVFGLENQILVHFDKMSKNIADIFAQLAPPTLSNGQTWKKCPKPSWQAFTPTPLQGNAHMETTHFKKGLPWGGCGGWGG